MCRKSASCFSADVTSWSAGGSSVPACCASSSARTSRAASPSRVSRSTACRIALRSCTSPGWARRASTNASAAPGESPPPCRAAPRRYHALLLSGASSQARAASEIAALCLPARWFAMERLQRRRASTSPPGCRSMHSEYLRSASEKAPFQPALRLALGHCCSKVAAAESLVRLRLHVLRLHASAAWACAESRQHTDARARVRETSRVTSPVRPLAPLCSRCWPLSAQTHASKPYLSTSSSRLTERALAEGCSASARPGATRPRTSAIPSCAQEGRGASWRWVSRRRNDVAPLGRELRIERARNRSVPVRMPKAGCVSVPPVAHTPPPPSWRPRT